jgi:SH3-like domain-containing protein
MTFNQALRLVILAAVPVASTLALGQGKPVETAASGLPLPRYVSLKSDKVNLRKGPGTEFPTVWVYRRAGLPVEVVREYEGWREIRDAEGISGWVVQSLLSGRRTALVEPWAVKPNSPPPQSTIYSDNSTNAKPVIQVEAGVIANVIGCDGKWCQITVEDFKGHMPQKQLWGVYEAEIIK